MNTTVKKVALVVLVLAVVYVGFGLYIGAWSVDYSRSEAAARNRNPGDPSGGGGAGGYSCPWYAVLYKLPC